ncbi:MAG: pitrilysin family protein [Gammaproteobacteria bacterium]|nr:pitrilysin family protein [Gammaproteobacteria bacterium]
MPIPAELPRPVRGLRNGLRKAAFRRALAVLALVPLVAFANQAGQEPAVGMAIPFQKFVLDNALTLIVHEDRKAPVVAVNVWYHVGSKNEQPGKTGFAHLFEHLMFNGTENYPGEFFEPFERVGATGMNGTTNVDRTNYFQVVPRNALDLALWMESDRMGHLLGAVDQARLDEQRGVVQNEKRQRENQPYGRVYDILFENLFPQGHPYSWSVIGSMEDLEAASLDDVGNWFNRYYGAANAVLVIAGDVQAQAAKARVEHYFGHIPAGPPLERQAAWVPKAQGKRRVTMQDRVPQARLYKAWTMPGYGTLDANRLDLVAGVLSEGKTSRLYKRLVYDERIASDVSAFAFPMEIAGLFGIVASALPGHGLAELDAAIEAEIAALVADGPTQEELARIVTSRRAAFIRGIERVGGFGGKSDQLARNETYMGDPAFHETRLARWGSATTAEVQAAAERWMTGGQVSLEVVPFPATSVTEARADRSRLPDTGTPPEAPFDAFERFALSNGLKVLLAERHAIPVVEMNLLVDAGFAADQFAAPGTANLTLAMLDEGTATRSALDISEEAQRLGARLSAGADLDTSYVSLSALKENLAESLDLYADIVLSPSFPAADFDRLQQLQLAGIQQEKVRPRTLALRLFPRILYGEGHAYSQPFTGSGDEASVMALEPSDLAAFHEAWFKPGNATLIVVGAVTREEIEPLLAERFSAWTPGEVPSKRLGAVMPRDESVVYLVDRPDSEQSVIIAGHIAPPRNHEADLAIRAMNQVLGGDFTARVNMNLREDKGWSYGARTQIVAARGQRPFMAVAPVQTDKTGAAMVELKREIEAMRGARPPEADEIAKVKDRRTLSLPGRWETAWAVADSLSEIVRFGLPDDYWHTYADAVRSLGEAEIRQAAVDVMRPEGLIWVVVGDRGRIEADIRELGIGEVLPIDSDGNPALSDAPGIGG